MSKLPEKMLDYEAYKQAMNIVKPVDAIEAFIGKFSPKLAFAISRKITSLATRKPYESYRKQDDKIEVTNAVVSHVPVRIYKPIGLKEGEKTSAIIYVHGGFWLIYNVEDYDQLMYTLANRTRSLVASIEYCLSPEQKFPKAVDQVFEVSKYLINNADEFNVDRSRIAICGDSTGGNMAAAVVHRLVKAKLAIKWQCLIQAPLQFVDLALPSYQQNVPSNQLNILTYSGLHRFLKEYLTIPSVTESMLETNSHVEQKQRQNLIENGYLSWDFIPEHYRQGYETINKSEVTAATPVFFNEDLSPLIASDDLLKECPSTHLITTEFDIFRDDSYIYAGRLNKLGVNATLKDYENGYHGALNLYQNEKFKFPQILFNEFVEFLLKNL